MGADAGGPADDADKRQLYSATIETPLLAASLEESILEQTRFGRRPYRPRGGESLLEPSGQGPQLAIRVVG